ncbi:COP9 signalosome complex subunit 4, partial [Coemansia sp. RSA 2673]
RKALAKLLADEGKWEDAARQLQGIRLEQSQGVQSVASVFPVYIWMTQLFDEAGNVEQAVLSLNRAAALVAQVLTHKYIEAAIIYQNIFQTNARGVADQAVTLGKAINCAVLAAAGPQKMRVLAGLHREKLAPTLPSFGLMEKMVLKRLIKPTELEQFSQQLEAHQRELLADGKTTVLSSAVREHNGRIDQIAGVITFGGAREVKEVAAAISMKRQAAEQPPPMHFRETVHARWDGRIVNLCRSIEDAVDLLIERQPVYSRTLFRHMD